jgi:CO/xanthine dehydrogenase Mo-binding subunit
MTPTSHAATSQLRIVGTEITRHDAVEKAAARTRYAADQPLPGMLYAMLKRSDEAHATLLRVDTEAAQAMPGVVAVYTAADVPHNTVWVDVPGQSVEIGALRAYQNVLADRVVRYHGEPIALVVAETEDAALAALDAIEVDYDPQPVVDNALLALDEDAPMLHPGGNLLARWEIEEGEVDAAFAAAAVTVEADYQTHFVDHAYLEPEAGTAFVDTDGVIVIRACTQVIEHFRDVAHILDVDDNRVRLIAPYVGGGFGGKEDMTVEPYVALAAVRTGRPVRMTWARQESLLARQNRHAVWMRYRTGADADGRLVAQDIELCSDGGAYAFLSALVLLYSTTHAQGPYRCPNVRIRSRVVYTNHTPCSAFRGFGGMQVALGYEGQMDAIAERLGLDPLDVRRRNFLRRGDTLAIGQPIDTHVALPALVDAVHEHLGARPAPSSRDRLVGRGFACNLQSYGRCVWLNDWSSAWLGFELDGSLVIRIGVPDIGCGQASSLIQIASEVLGVPASRITIHIGDSALTPLTGTTTATRQLYMSGNAVLKAASGLRDGLVGVAASLLGVDTDLVVLGPDGASTPAGDSQPVAFATLVRACVQRNVAWQQLSVFHAGKGEPWQTDSAWRGRVLPDFTYGCHGVDIEVDPLTGTVRVLRYVAAHDVGRAINPQSVRGQIEGGVAMGLGYALTEQVVFDHCQNLTGTFAQYLVPTADDLPDIEAIILESGEGLGPFSARGIGEPPVGPPAPAIAAAINDATGKRLRVLPFTQDRVADAIAAEAR